MNRAILILLLLSASVFAAAPWPGVDYAEVRAFAWDPAKTPPTEELVRKDFSLVDGVINKDGVVLTAVQVQRLLRAQAHRFTDRPVAGCYTPHNAFVFYNARKRPVAFLEVCFDCLGSRTQPHDKDADPDFVALAAICAELKLPFGKQPTVEAFRKENAWILAPETSKPK
jgi:hypothetical protein